MTSPGWSSWLERNAQLIGSDDHGDEWLFASELLPRVHGLRPECVTPQREVRVDNRARRIDFAVEQDGLRLAMEIDGWDKTGTGTGMDRRQHQDFLDRQNGLVLEGWTPVRFTPTQVRHDQAAVVSRIEQAMARQLVAARSQAGPVARSGPSSTTRTTPAPVAEQPVRHGAASAPTPSGSRAPRVLVGLGVAAALAVAVGSFLTQAPSGGSADVDPPMSCAADGVVRGNVASGGERIYHMPGDRYYDATIAEQCFATPQQAEAAGYRRAKV